MRWMLINIDTKFGVMLLLNSCEIAGRVYKRFFASPARRTITVEKTSLESSPGSFVFIMCTVRAFTMQILSTIRNGLFLPRLFVTSFLSSVVRVFNLMRGSTQKQAFYFRMIRRPHVPRTKYKVPDTYTTTICTAAGAVYSTYPDRTAVRKKLTPLESRYGSHLPARAASARADRGS